MFSLRSLLVVAVAALALCVPAFAADADGKSPGATMISHDVYFTLKDKSPESKAKLVALCKKHLTGHDGTVFFAAGVLADDLKRDVNDLDFDVALHIVFADKAAHDKYQTAPRHLEFIKEGKDGWAKVRVFDSYVGK